MSEGLPVAWAKRFALAILIVLLFCVPVVLRNDYWLFVFCLAWINVLWRRASGRYTAPGSSP